MRTKKLRGRQLIEIKCLDCGALIKAVDEPQRNKAGYRAAMQGLAPNVVIRVPSSCPACRVKDPFIATTTAPTAPKAPRKTDALADKQIAERKAAKPGKAGPKAAKARKRAASKTVPAKKTSKKGRR